uniref:DNA-directed RNA polymerase n=1 Tax=Taiwanofungus camphoratus TaxID=2696576 RepID=A0A4D6SU38_TAICA|nr:DNA-directed RNA polymerase [Taiwanofungus camphoratus]QCG69991.1 DNA-directed RNA polymerase [Taiwanofungus camphoratus]UKQ56126.1 DNA-directed RNA polymerase [Taiwanofungus camphoratus]WRO45194.1 DNA-directed RNA polymerase [Taiwanofungus sp. YW-2023a]
MGLSKFIEDKYSELNGYVSNTVLISIGLKLLNFLEEVGLIHSELYILDKVHKNLIYVANEKILDVIGKSFGLLSISYKIPMIVPHKLYGRAGKKDILGGYFLNDKEFIAPIIIKNSELREQSYIDDNNIIFDTVNNLSSVGYKINIPVLEFILEKGLEYDLFIAPNFQHPLEINKKIIKKN